MPTPSSSSVNDHGAVVAAPLAEAASPPCGGLGISDDGHASTTARSAGAGVGEDMLLKRCWRAPGARRNVRGYYYARTVCYARFQPWLCKKLHSRIASFNNCQQHRRASEGVFRARFRVLAQTCLAAPSPRVQPPSAPQHEHVLLGFCRCYPGYDWVQ